MKGGISFILGSFLAAETAHGHGFMSSPRSRNYVANIEGEWWGNDDSIPTKETCHHCLNVPSVCGTTGSNNYDSPSSVSGGALLQPKIQATFTAGEEIDIETTVTAHHKGHFTYKVCPVQPYEVPTQACFDDHPLMFVADNMYGGVRDKDYPDRAYIANPDHPDYTGLFNHRFKLPRNVTGNMVLLQWHWVSANSCLPPGYDSYPFPEFFEPSSTVGNCQDALGEQFWNCAEIKILGSGVTPTESPIGPGTDVPSMAPVLSPNPTPTKNPVAQPTTYPSDVPSPSPSLPPTSINGGGVSCGAKYVEGTAYEEGDTVSVEGGKYTCKPFPNSGWCSGVAWAYAPKSGLYWEDAWTYDGVCGGSPSTPSSAPTVNAPIQSPVVVPTKAPTIQQTAAPSNAPSQPPVVAPTPTKSPVSPTSAPVKQPASTPSPVPTSPTVPSSAVAGVEEVLASSKDAMNSELFVYQNPQNQWEESSVYRFDGFLQGLRVMYEDGVAGKLYYMGEDAAANGHHYGLVNIAAFLAQSMKETIKYDACDENSWDRVNEKYPLSNACGQLGQSYEDYHCSEAEKHMECPVDPNMSIKATTNAKWYGAPQPLFCGPKSEYPETGFWDYSAECNKPWASPPEHCVAYEGQLAGKEDNTTPWANANGRTDVEGCCWWGRGVIQTTGVCNFGKLNYFLGKRAEDEGRPSRYPTIDFCADPGAICASQEFQELKWIAGLFYWIESVQTYDVDGWNYLDNLKAFVDGGMKDQSFINAVSGIVNRGCHSPPCGTGQVDGGPERASNFQKALNVFNMPSNRLRLLRAGGNSAY